MDNNYSWMQMRVWQLKIVYKLFIFYYMVKIFPQEPYYNQFLLFIGIVND